MKNLIYVAAIMLTLFSCQERQIENINRVEQEFVTEKIDTKQNEDLHDSIRVFDYIEENPYPYDTLLSNGYFLKHKVFREIEYGDLVQSLTLCKGSVDIKEFGYSSFGLPYKNIGYVGADFDKSFALVYSFGSGNPHIISLIDKSTGKQIKKGIWVDANELEQILLYIDDEHKDGEQLKIFDIKHQNEIEISDFNDSICISRMNGGLRDCIVIDTVTAKSITLKVGFENEQIIKKYYR